MAFRLQWLPMKHDSWRIVLGVIVIWAIALAALLANPGCAPPVVAREPDDAPRSGDSGPPDDRWGGPGSGNGVRSVGSAR